jgi:hypothetical protein
VQGEGERASNLIISGALQININNW